MDSKTKLNYDSLKWEIIDFLETHKLFILATSADNLVTARTINCVNKELTMFFRTDSRFLKYKQIEQNPNVALCADNLQIEGEAKIIGNPTDKSNPEIIETYLNDFTTDNKSSIDSQYEVIIKVTPILISLWKSDEKIKAYKDFLNVVDETAKREIY